MKTVLLILLALVLLVLVSSLIMVLVNFRRRRRQKLSPRALRPYLPQLEAEAKRLRSMGMKHLYCKSGRFRLHAQYLDQGSQNCAILLHGIGGRGQDRFLDAQFYLDRGYNLLFPDLRANGSSRGLWQGMGHYERSDLLCWTEMMVKKLGPDCRLVMDGTSMGAAAALLFAGDGRERNLAAVIADCSFSSAEELIRYRIKSHYLPSGLFLPFIRLWGRLLMGYDLRKASPVALLPRCRVPVFFLHGEEDDVVPCYMVRQLSAACDCPKTVLTIPDARHAACRVERRDLCEMAMDQFLKARGL